MAAALTRMSTLPRKSTVGRRVRFSATPARPRLPQGDPLRSHHANSDPASKFAGRQRQVPVPNRHRSGQSAVRRSAEARPNPLAPPVTTATRRRSFNRLHLRRSVAALWVAPVSRCPDQTQSPRPRVQASAAGLARSDESCPTNNPSAEGAFARTATRSALRRGRIGRNGGQVFNLPPNVSTPGRNVSTLGPNVSTFANEVFTFPDPMVIRPASSGSLLPNPGRPSAYLFRAVGHLQLVARDIQAEKHGVGHSSTRRATLASHPALYRRALRQRAGRDDRAHRRSRTTQGSSVCPGPTTALDGPRPSEHASRRMDKGFSALRLTQFSISRPASNPT